MIDSQTPSETVRVALDLLTIGDEADVRPLQGGTTRRAWKVVASEGVYLLRMRPLTGQSRRHFEWRSQWQAALHQRWPGRFPVVVRSATAPSRGPTSGRPMLVSLETWVEGHHLRATDSFDQARLIAELLNAMHRTSLSWPNGADPGAPHYSPGALADEWRSLAVFLKTGAHPPTADTGAVLEAAVTRGLATLGELERSPDEVGAIHADLHDGNLLYGGTPLQARAIDFDRSGRGCYALDVAMAGHYLSDSVAESLVAQYEREGMLSAEARSAMPALRLLAAVDNFATLSKVVDERAWVRAEVPHLERLARRVVSETT